MTLEQAWFYLASFVTGCSLLSLLLPPVEFFDEFPRFQKFYRLFCKIIVKWGSLDVRGKVITMYDSYQKKNGNGTPAST
jgi:hypothetical protein